MEAILPDWQVLVVQVITFVVGMWLIWMLYMVPLRKHLKSRREGISRDLASAEAARKEAEQLRAKLQADRAQMAEDLRRSKEQAKAEIGKLRDELMAKARAEQQALIKEGRRQLQAETGQAKEAVRAYASRLVVQAASKLIGKRIDSGTDKALAEKLVASVKASRN